MENHQTQAFEKVELKPIDIEALFDKCRAYNKGGNFLTVYNFEKLLKSKDTEAQIVGKLLTAVDNINKLYGSEDALKRARNILRCYGFRTSTIPAQVIGRNELLNFISLMRGGVSYMKNTTIEYDVSTEFERIRCTRGKMTAIDIYRHTCAGIPDYYVTYRSGSNSATFYVTCKNVSSLYFLEGASTVNRLTLFTIIQQFYYS